MPTRLASRTPVIVLSAVIGLLLVAAAAVGTAAATMPGCEFCHAKDGIAKATAKGPHASVACGSCHGGSTIDSRVDFGLNQVFGMVLRVKAIDPTLAAVDAAQCDACHAKGIEQAVESAGLRIVHASCAQGRDCTSCHSTTAHGEAVSWPRTSTMDMCFDCHGVGGATAECDACHSARLPRDRVKTGTFAVTHGPDYLKTHGMGQMSSCGACHPPAKCESCHGPGVPHAVDFVNKHAAEAKAKTAKCTGCHQKKFCDDCHQTSMPHTVEFKRGHGAIVDASGEKPCLRCHEKADCTSCHESHVHPVTAEQMEQFQNDGDGE